MKFSRNVLFTMKLFRSSILCGIIKRNSLTIFYTFESLLYEI